MKIILNADAVTQPLTGIGRYTLELSTALIKNPKVHSLRMFSGGRWINNIDLIQEANQWLAVARKYVPFKYLAMQAYSQLRDRRFQQLTTDLTDHLFHSPNFLLMPYDGPSVVTVHDLSFIHHPQSQPAARVKFLQKQLISTLQKADAIITPSKFIKQDLINHYPQAEDKTFAVPMGVSDQFYPRSEAEHQKVRDQLSLPADFLLSVATLEPRKNLHRLIQSFLSLPNHYKQNFPLVLVGAKGWPDRELSKQIRQAHSNKYIFFTGYVSEEQLSTLYSAATGLVFPSIYEGFGLPILEAMRSGTAVLTSNNSALAEVADGRTLLCDPYQVDDVADKIKQLIDDQQWRNKVATENRDYAQQLSWAHCAQSTLDVYKKALADSQR